MYVSPSNNDSKGKSRKVTSTYKWNYLSKLVNSSKNDVIYIIYIDRNVQDMQLFIKYTRNKKGYTHLL